ncbi:MAG: DMT family transporter, partial [Candidatus Limnocylindrales bacterium]
FTFEAPLTASWGPEGWLAVIWLGLVGSASAYLVFFRLLSRWGATRTSLVAYLLPVYGIALGVLVLGEPIDATLLLGTALVIGGIAIVNARSMWPGSARTQRATAIPSSMRHAASAATPSSMPPSGNRP